ncbi:MAG: hypothetical protein Unbinned706contig1000_36 [Prokaryotic dsDNA virus sp.]|nr:MAG: hypothetical protein Unbinned706contig1000_36 [Prokaryotic dsDNA virus sp.]|tara:strand:- start:32505 stop:32627 length:123 start_codon:yes stop_codon:yes gene_type:complete
MSELSEIEVELLCEQEEQEARELELLKTRQDIQELNKDKE